MKLLDNTHRTDDIKLSVPIHCGSHNADGSIRGIDDEIICEHTIEISVNGKLAFRLSCSPSHLSELVVGRLCTEGFISDTDEVERIFICGRGDIAEVTLCKDISMILSEKEEPTCCTDNKQLLVPETHEQGTKLLGTNIDDSVIFELAEKLKADSALHKSTGGAHSCYIRFPDGRIECFEDIGRHNAIDKAVGCMLLERQDPGKCVLFTTGRLTADMVNKVIAARIPVIISKAAVSDKALKLSEEYGIRLIFKAWPDSYKTADMRQ